MFLLAGPLWAQQTASLSKEEKDGLQYMREEEKLARDVYDSMFVKWELNPFGNIRHSERMHMSRMKDVLDVYNVDDPVASTRDVPGQFQNKDMQKIYNDLVESGTRSLADALKAGALIEELDIADLDTRIAKTDKENILSAYRFLRMGSENHLRAFVRRLRSQGIEYKPVHLNQEAFDKILEEENGGCCGQGQGRRGN